MSWYATSALVAGVVNLLLSWIVYVKRKRDLVAKYFSLITALIAIGTFGTFGIVIAKTSQQALFWSRITYLATIPIPAMALQWTLVVSGKRRKNNPIIILCLFISIILLYFSFSSWFIKEVKPANVVGYSIIPNIVYYLFLIFFIVTIFFAFGELFKTYRISKGRKHIQLKYFFLALIFAFIGGTLYFPLSLFPDLHIPPLDNIILIGFTSIIAYAIIKHRLMDIRLIVLKSVAYTLTLAGIAGGYITFTVLVFDKLESLINPLALNVITLFALVFTFNLIRRFIEAKTDKLFAKGRYDFNALLAQLSDIAKKNSRSITGLTTKVMQTLTKEMRINKAAFVLTNSPTLASVRTLGFTSKSKTLWDKPTKLAAQANEAIVYDELEEDSKEKEILRKADVQVLIPIRTEHEMEAVLALGEKKSGDMYTSQDLNLLELVAPQIALALENAKSFKEKEQRIAELKSINKMFHHIEHFLDLDHLLQEIADEAIKVTGAEGGSLMLLNKGGKTLSIKTARNLHPLISLNAKIKVGEGLAGTVAKTHEPLILNGLGDKKFRPYLKREDIVSAISVPMKAGDKLVGVLNVNRKKLRVEFSKENLNVMTAFASQAAEAIEKAGYYHKIEKLSVQNDNQFKEFTKALAKTVDAKDPYTYGHSEAVTGYALEIATEMGLSEAQLRVLEIGGRLHDMGKIGISERILNKPGSLTDEEYKAIQRHPEIGADILKDTHYLKGIKELILYHHERFDGKGYPTGLKGKDIPLGARILAVADTYDAMTSHRAYRPALSKKIAVAEITKCSGGQFDPDIAKVFLKILDRKKLRIIKNTTHQAAYIAEAKAHRLNKKAE